MDAIKRIEKTDRAKRAEHAIRSYSERFGMVDDYEAITDLITALLRPKQH